MNPIILPVGAQPTPQLALAKPLLKATPAPAARDPRADKVRHAAAEFESMLVKQLLKGAKLGQSGDDSGEGEKASGYADMAVDALASAIEHGGGLGLARTIEHAVGSQMANAVPPAASAGRTTKD